MEWKGLAYNFVITDFRLMHIFCNGNTNQYGCYFNPKVRVEIIIAYSNTVSGLLRSDIILLHKLFSIFSWT